MSRCCRAGGRMRRMCVAVACGAQSNLRGHDAEVDDKPAHRPALLRGRGCPRKRDPQESHCHHTRPSSEMFMNSPCHVSRRPLDRAIGHAEAMAEYITRAMTVPPSGRRATTCRLPTVRSLRMLRIDLAQCQSTRFGFPVESAMRRTTWNAGSDGASLGHVVLRPRSRPKWRRRSLVIRSVLAAHRNCRSIEAEHMISVADLAEDYQ